MGVTDLRGGEGIIQHKTIW